MRLNYFEEFYSNVMLNTLVWWHQFFKSECLGQYK